MSYHAPKRILPRENNGSQSEIKQLRLKRRRSDDLFASSPRLESLESLPYESTIPQIPRHPIEHLHGRQILPLPQGNRPPQSDRVSVLDETQDTQTLGTFQEKFDDRICFGMLREIQARIDPVQDSLPLRFNEIRGELDMFASLELSIQDDRCDILSQGTHIATLNSKTHHALSCIRLPETPKWIGVIPLSELEGKVNSAAERTSPKLPSITCTISILVTGPSSIAQTLARELAAHHLFLQHPDPKLHGMKYDNPQYLALPGRSIFDGPILPPLLKNPNQRELNGSDEDSENLSDDPDDDLNEVPQKGIWSEVQDDFRIRTKLESHQGQAVNFIIARESIHSNQKNLLWRIQGHDAKEPLYKHMITGVCSTKLEDIRGGILADDMGLGKTFSMIASIVADLPQPQTDASLVNSILDRSTTKSKLVLVRSTLVIVPSILLLEGWIDEIKKHIIPNTLNYYKYHGPERTISLSTPPINYVIFSTYATVESDFTSSYGNGVLNRIHWHRVILDEEIAHTIRNSSTKQFKAINSLSASIRWCMTGTPIQNSLSDLLSLTRFLRVPSINSAEAFRKHMTKQSKSRRQTCQPNFVNLKLLLESICLRRTMSTVFPTLGGSFIYYRPSFSDEERAVYDGLSRACEIQLKAAASNHSPGQESKMILTAKLRLRMFCNTGLNSLFLRTNDDDDTHLTPDDIITFLQEMKKNICSVCKMEIFSLDWRDTSSSSGSWLSLGNVLKCETCVLPQNGVNEIPAPSLAMGLVNEDPMEGIEQTTPNEVISNTSAHTKTYPSKLLTLLGDIEEHYLEDKSIVFSFWKQSLDVVSQMFDHHRIEFCRVDGHLAPAQRQDVLKEFQQKSSIRVLIMTIGTGAVGLNNLSVANRIHILEPQWNPSVESQAIGRALRWGQDKRVVVIRYIMQKTVEEVIENQQKWKNQFSLNNRDLQGK